jgi:unsaturated rhamnogalacturonyl hydrolase
MKIPGMIHRRQNIPCARWWRLAVLAAAQALIAACSGDTSDGGARNASNPSTTTQMGSGGATSGSGGGGDMRDGSATVDPGMPTGDHESGIDDAARADGFSSDEARECDAGATDWGKALVNSTRQRMPTPAAIGGWGYQPALFLHGAYLVYQRTRDPSYLTYIKAWVDAHVSAQGNIDATIDSLDNMMPGLLVLDMYEATKDARYKSAVDNIRKRFDTYPRTTDGAFWHNTGLVGQTWGDGVFMALPFLSRYGKLFGDSAYTDDEVTKQLLLYHEHLKHPAGIHYHAWDEQGDAAWTNAQTKHSPESWCRANGWFGMASIEVLESIAPNHPQRQAVIDVLAGLIDGWSKLQDPTTGRYWQVIDKATAAGNWLETSCTSMITYTISRAVERGYIDASHVATSNKGYQGVMQKVSLDPGGLTNVTDICIGTSVGDLAYYLARPRNTNDFHGLGAFLIMYEQLAPRCP